MYRVYETVNGRLELSLIVDSHVEARTWMADPAYTVIAWHG